MSRSDSHLDRPRRENLIHEGCGRSDGIGERFV